MNKALFWREMRGSLGLLVIFGGVLTLYIVMIAGLYEQGDPAGPSAILRYDAPVDGGGGHERGRGNSALVSLHLSI